MQLVAYGAQDIYLTGNPQITFFKVVYRRHTNFSMESIQQSFNGTVDFGRKAKAMTSNGNCLPILSGLSSVEDWDLSIIRERSRNFGELIWNELSSWIGL